MKTAPSKHPSIRSSRGVLALASGVVALGIASVHAQVLLNGNFESGSGTSITSWSTAATDANKVITLSASAQSPFTSGTQGVNITTASGATGAAPKLYQSISSTYGSNTSFSLAFDFLSQGSYSSTDGALIVRLFANSGTNQVISFRGDGSIAMNGVTTAASSYSKNTWYHASMEVPSIFGSQTATSITLTLTPWVSGAPGTPVSFTGSWAMTGGTYYNTFQIQQGFGLVPGANVDVDNVAMAVVPEPAAATLLLGAGLGMVLLRRCSASGRDQASRHPSSPQR